MFSYNYTPEITSSTLQIFSCLLNSLTLTASHITQLVCKLLYFWKVCNPSNSVSLILSLRLILLGCLESSHVVLSRVEPSLMLWPTVSTTKFVLLLGSFWFVDVGHSLWIEDGSVVYNCCCPSPAQSFSGPSPVGLATIFYCLRYETSFSVATYDSQGYGGGIRPHLHMEYFLVWQIPRVLLPSVDRVQNTQFKGSVSRVHCNCLFMNALSRGRVHTRYLGKDPFIATCCNRN
jgi:hypothetical protein